MTVLRTMEGKQSKMTVMFRVVTYPFGCFASKPISIWGESITCFLMEGRALCLLEKLKEPELLFASPWQPLFNCVTYLHQSETPTWDFEIWTILRIQRQFRIHSKRRHPAATVSLRGVAESESLCGTTWAELPVVWQSVVLQSCSSLEIR